MLVWLGSGAVEYYVLELLLVNNEAIVKDTQDFSIGNLLELYQNLSGLDHQTALDEKGNRLKRVGDELGHFVHSPQVEILNLNGLTVRLILFLLNSDPRVRHFAQIACCR